MVTLVDSSMRAFPDPSRKASSRRPSVGATPTGWQGLSLRVTTRSSTDKTQQLERRGRCQAPGPTIQRAQVQVSRLHGRHRDDQLVGLALKLDLDAFVSVL